MMQELLSAEGGAGAGAGLADPTTTSTPKPKAPAAAATSSKKEEPDFQSQIRKTMERINASDSTATASTSAAPSSEEDMLAAMMKELAGGAGGADGEEGDFNSMLMNMMAHLTNKEILYEPMKELHDKFPAWMTANAEKQNPEDLERYKEQQRLVGEIVGRFERKGYKDENEEDREYIVERMQKVCLPLDTMNVIWSLTCLCV
jgi:peroxin-19